LVPINTIVEYFRMCQVVDIHVYPTFQKIDIE
jgi:hypothetical protein